MDALQVEPSEFELIKYPERGTCLYRCGNERYLLQVIAPEYKAVIFRKGRRAVSHRRQTHNKATVKRRHYTCAYIFCEKEVIAYECNGCGGT